MSSGSSTRPYPSRLLIRRNVQTPKTPDLATTTQLWTPPRQVKDTSHLSNPLSSSLTPALRRSPASPWMDAPQLASVLDRSNGETRLKSHVPASEKKVITRPLKTPPAISHTERVLKHELKQGAIQSNHTSDPSSSQRNPEIWKVGRSSIVLPGGASIQQHQSLRRDGVRESGDRHRHKLARYYERALFSLPRIDDERVQIHNILKQCTHPITAPYILGQPGPYRKPLRFDVGDTRRLIIEDSLAPELLKRNESLRSELEVMKRRMSGSSDESQIAATPSLVAELEEQLKIRDQSLHDLEKRWEAIVDRLEEVLPEIDSKQRVLIEAGNEQKVLAQMACQKLATFRSCLLAVMGATRTLAIAQWPGMERVLGILGKAADADDVLRERYQSLLSRYMQSAEQFHTRCPCGRVKQLCNHHAPYEFTLDLTAPRRKIVQEHE